MEKNNSIGCIVSECKFHAHNEDYCTLYKIQVTKHEYDTTSIEGTDCGSFERE